MYSDNHQPVHLKRPFTRRCSILLVELVAILMALEYVLQNLAAMPCRLAKAFNDSETAVGILSLNWKDISYRDVTRDIKKAITLLEQANILVEVSWAPRHSSIAGNEEAELLAKELLKKLAPSQTKERHQLPT